MTEGFSLKKQRDVFLQTLRNDIVLKQFRKEDHKNCFNQLGAGRLFSEGLWDSSLFRLMFSIGLPPMFLFSDVFVPLKYSFRKIFHKRKKYQLNRLYLHQEKRLLTLSKSAGIQSTDDVWFQNPFDTMTLPKEYKTLSALDFISFAEIWKAVWQAIILHVTTIITLGYDKYFLSFRAYEWCIADFALRHIPLDVNMTFSCICDRMAILYDHLPHANKTMIQHGVMHFHNLTESSSFSWQEDLGAYIWKSLYKSSPTTVYCFTEDDIIALSRSVIANQPKFIIMGYGFKPSFKPEKKSVLIVGNPTLFIKYEGQIIKELQGLDIELYLKNHPAEVNSKYDSLRNQFNFNFIEGKDTRFPDVDLLISYDSTLAYEYASVGAKVLYYGHFDINNIRNIVIDELSLLQE